MKKSPTIKELREAYNFDIKKETKKYAMVGYRQGFSDALYCAKDALYQLADMPVVRTKQIIELLDGWYKNAEKELEKVKKEQEW